MNYASAATPESRTATVTPRPVPPACHTFGALTSCGDSDVKLPGGYAGPRFQAGLRRALRQVDLGIVKRSDAAEGFTVLPKRWIVERTIAWLNRCRRLAKDWECLNRNALAFLRWASVRLMVRRLCQTST